MILITGGTGFIGKALARRLVEQDHAVRLLIRPSRQTPDLPRGIPLEVAVSSLSDARSLQGAMVGVDTVYHLASAEWQGVRGSLLKVDVGGARAISRAAHQAGVRRIFFLSHLGADRASAFALLKAKAIAEEMIRNSQITYTIFRSGVVFGKNDHFTTNLVKIARALPFFLIPGDGRTLLQPLWVEDLATLMSWALENPGARDQTISVGGPEFLTFEEILQLTLNAANLKRPLWRVPLPYMKILTIFLNQLLPGFPATPYSIDYLATNHTCSLDTIPRVFNLLPSRFAHRLEHLQEKPSRRILPAFRNPQK